GLRRKKRYNLGREVRLLRARGPLGLEFVAAPAAVGEFVAALGRLASASGRPWADVCPGLTPASAPARLADAARRGLLGSYVLRCAGEPVAGVFGYRHGDRLLIEATAYAREYARFSPGAVLLHLLIEDAIGRGVRVLDFGVGNPVYGHASGLTAREGENFLLWRRSAANRIRLAMYGAFQSSVRCARGWAVWAGVLKQRQLDAPEDD
ncbi:MAG: GNAT family N-acetyltransferase, partial [Gemmataceae bacterium]|nr:GNAT family N-acetyltransferase [Gemmataceae bacterium]